MAVNLQEDIKPISYIKSNAAEMMSYVNDNKNPIIITQNGEARGVLLDIESYQNMQDAFNLLRILQVSQKDIETGHYKPSEKVLSRLRSKYVKHEKLQN